MNSKKLKEIEILYIELYNKLEIEVKIGWFKKILKVNNINNDKKIIEKLIKIKKNIFFGLS